MEEKPQKTRRAHYGGSLLLAIAAVLFEIYTPLGVAAGVVYAPLVLLSIWHKHPYSTYVSASIATLLILSAYFFLPENGTDLAIVLINRGLSIMAVWVTAIIVQSQKAIGTKLSKLEKLQRQTLDSAPIGIALVSVAGEFIRVNPALCNIFGYTEEELLNLDLKVLNHPDDLSIGSELREKLRNNDIKSFEIDKRYLHKDGTAIRLRITVGSVGDSGRPQEFVIQALDITAKEIAEAKLNAARKFQELILETVPDFLFVKDSDLRIVQANQAFLEVYPEEKRNEVIGSTTLEEYAPEEVELFTANDRVAFETGYHETEEQIQFPNGKQITIFTKKTRFYDEGKAYILAVCRDISHLKEIQSHLVKANEELEMFSYIASHDLKAPLRGIDNLSQWIYDDLKEVINEETEQQFLLMRSRVKRLESMLEDILEYSRIGRIVESPVNVNLDKLVRSIFDNIEASKNFTLDIQEPLPTIMSPETPIEQIFSNIMNNAIKHHDQYSGKIVITYKDNADSYEFSIQDDGPGIESRFHDKVFAMFQTLQSRDVTEGTGLGMSIVKKLVEWQGGYVRLQSSEGERGTNVIFTWPKSFRISEEPVNEQAG